ncbi:MAG TPA: carboxypeptidase regulatory-like domain-containing protein [Longimicrobium sp.]
MISALLLFALHSATLQGTVRAEGSGAPVTHAVVRVVELGRGAPANAAGQYSLAVPEGRWRVRVQALGYDSYEASVQVPATGAVRFDFELAPVPVRLQPLSVEAAGSRGTLRALQEREVTPGIVAVSQEEIRSIPALGEPDVLRSLQGVPGVVALNDLNAQLHVRGGGPDQNIFLLDGARVYAPYHLFGIVGVFNADAIAGAEFFRGSLPARFGGALSSVIQLEQREGADRGVEGDAGVSLLSARAVARGALPGGRWMVAGRSSYPYAGEYALFGGNFPYSFHDFQGRVTLDSRPGSTIQGSFFSSSDDFAIGQGETGRQDLRSRWRNHVGSLRWVRDPARGWSTSAAAWGSAYGGDMDVGVAAEGRVGTATVENRLLTGGVRLEAARGVAGRSYRMGVEVEGGRVALEGSPLPGGYFQGSERATYLRSAGYGEADLRVGAVRLAPGLRVSFDAERGELFAEPRLSARYQVGENTTFTVGAGRSHQVLSTLRDDRQVLPGTVLWFVHPDSAPASRTDGVSATLDGWLGRAWSYSLGTYARRFESVASWTPEGSRELSRLSWDDGSAQGGELSLRRHGRVLSGWASYGIGRVRLTNSETGAGYDASWDRRHAVDAAVIFRPRPALTFSTQASYGSGMPFWPWVGSFSAERLSPLLGRTVEGREAPVYGDRQMRFPAYFRMDLAARYGFGVRGVELQPNLTLRNVTMRRNVLYYSAGGTGSHKDGGPALYPVAPPFPLPMAVSIGLDVRL